MIVCPNCSKENQDHYKFCLGCGSDLPRDGGGEDKPRSTPTPPSGIPSVVEPEPPRAARVSEPPAPPTAGPAPTGPVAAPVAAPVPAVGEGSPCSSCGAYIPPGFAFCGACGAGAPGAQPTGGNTQASAPFNPGSARLVLIQPDGTVGGQVEIPSGGVTVGRDAGGFFANDAFMSPSHAIFRSENQEVVVTDDNSLNGVFVKLPPNVSIEVRSGQILRIGQELLLFEAVDFGSTAPDGTHRLGSPIEGLWGRVALIVARGRIGNAFPIGGDGVILGRERGNILFPEDGYVSGLHLRVHMENNRYYVTDLGSSNGSYIKVNSEIRVGSGDFVLMGQQLFRIDV